MNQPKSFVVYRRVGNVVTPHQATLVTSHPKWVDGKPQGLPTAKVVVGQAISWTDLYGGHTGWIADQMDRTRDAIAAERARRAARKQGPVAQAPVAPTAPAA